MTYESYLKSFGYKLSTKDDLIDNSFRLESETFVNGSQYSTVGYKGVTSNSIYTLFLTEKSYKQTTLENIILNCINFDDGSVSASISTVREEKGYQIQITFIKEK